MKGEKRMNHCESEERERAAAEEGKSFSFPEDIFPFFLTHNKYILILSLQANHHERMKSLIVKHEKSYIVFPEFFPHSPY